MARSIQWAQPPLFPHQFPSLRLTIEITFDGPADQCSVSSIVSVFPNGEHVALKVVPFWPMDMTRSLIAEMLDDGITEVLRNLLPF